MIRLARLAIRRPAASLATIVLIAGALSLIGLGISGSLSPSVTTVPGTESSRAEHLAEAEFGPGVLVPILLEGSTRELDRQGPLLVRALTKRPDTRVLSAWDAGATGKQLRASPTQAMIVASVAQPMDKMVESVQADVEKVVDDTTGGDVESWVTGQASIDSAMNDEAIDSTRRGVLITIPILFVVLVLLLRAPLVALSITALATGTALAGQGLTALLGKVIDVDAIGVLAGSLAGLALGAGYGVLFFRRWRSELIADRHHDAAHAASKAVETSGRALLIGGTALVLANIVANLIGPTKVLTSLGIGATLCAALAIGAAVVAMPAGLVLFGNIALRYSFGVPGVLSRGWDKLTGGGGGFVVRDAIPVGAGATALLAVLAIPLLSLETGPPGAKYLPADNAARQDYEKVADVMGPGWTTPYNIVIVSEKSPLTEPALLTKVDRFQDGLARDARISSVVGPGLFAATQEDLGVLPEKLRESTKLLKGGKKDLGKLEGGLGKAGAGAQKLRSGLESAASGAGQLQSGSGSAQAGAGKLRAGLEQARSGASQISAGLGAALTGAKRLRDGSLAALTGSKKISGGLGQAVQPVKAGVPIVRNMAADIGASSTAVGNAQGTAQALTAQLDEAAAQVAAMPAGPERQAAAAAVASARQAAGGLVSSLTDTRGKLGAASGIANAFSGQIAELSQGLAALYAGSTELSTGIGQLQQGNSELAAGIAKLSGGGGQLTAGVTALRDGAGQLEAGLGQLTGGAGQLASGLAAGTGPTGQLAGGLGRLESGVAEFRANLPSPEDIERLGRESPGLFESGYFVLSAIDGAPPSQRNQATFAVNLDQGGTAGQIVVVANFAMDDAKSPGLGEDLKRDVDEFAAATNTQAALGGPAGSLGDFRSESASRIWPVVIGVSVVVLLLLIAMLRTVVLPVVAVAFDLLTAAATFGIMALLFSGDDPILGGPGYIDPMSILATFTLLFGITIVYEVQLLFRTREAFMATGDPHGALRTGLNGTAAATTGAAIAMLAAVLPFVVPDLAVVRQLAVGVATVIVLDAFIVRPVLLPAAVEVLGRLSWWPLSRKAPHPPSARPQPPEAPPAAAPGRPVAGGLA